MQQNDIVYLKSQLTAARNELNKLRQVVRNLQCKQQKDIENIAGRLKDYHCDGCCHNLTNHNNSNESLTFNEASSKDNTTTATPGHQQDLPSVKETFPTIGVVRTCFPEKRGVPRQSSIGGQLRGVIELHPSLFTNPQHALEGLEEYSHLWIIYHFHKNSSHVKAKVAPPRLGGERVGVFATRSPHRPCPIGMSLVEIEKIDGATISFFGTDMVDNTPVLDIKPYIPLYDAPMTVETGRLSVGLFENALDFYDSRQEPDGEESELEMLSGAAAVITSIPQTPVNFPTYATPPPMAVKVPAWVQAQHRLTVVFNERAESQLQSLNVQKQCIIDILEADPRSVYLRTKYNAQIFTFQLSETTVTCRFDDKNSRVTVLQIRPTEHLQENDISPQTDHKNGEQM